MVNLWGMWMKSLNSFYLHRFHVAYFCVCVFLLLSSLVLCVYLLFKRAYSTTPDWKIELTDLGKQQAIQCGLTLKDMIKRNNWDCTTEFVCLDDTYNEHHPDFQSQNRKPKNKIYMKGVKERKASSTFDALNTQLLNHQEQRTILRANFHSIDYEQ